MTKIWTPRNWLENIGIGGLAALLGCGGFGLWFWAGRNYRLVLRDEMTFLDTPTLFVVGGLLFSVVALWLLKRLALRQNRKVGWYWVEGGKSHHRGGPLRWEDVLFGIVPGVTLGTIGAGLWLNCELDSSPQRTYFPKIVEMVVSRSSGSRNTGTSYYLRLTDWKKPGSHIFKTVKSEIYLSHRVGDTLAITTKKGLLGYEWIVRVK